MPAPHPQANGHRRRELVKRVKREESFCALCDELVYKELTYLTGVHGPRCKAHECAGCVPHPKRGEVDEDIPRSRGGSPYLRSNCHLMHRDCNRWKGTMTLAEARTKRNTQTTKHTSRSVTTSNIW